MASLLFVDPPSIPSSGNRNSPSDNPPKACSFRRLVAQTTVGSSGADLREIGRPERKQRDYRNDPLKSGSWHPLCSTLARGDSFGRERPPHANNAREGSGWLIPALYRAASIDDVEKGKR